MGLTKGVKLPPHTTPAHRAQQTCLTSPCWRNRVLALSQSHLGKEKGQLCQSSQGVAGLNTLGLLHGGPCLAEPGTSDHRKAQAYQGPQSRTKQTLLETKGLTGSGRGLPEPGWCPHGVVGYRAWCPT